MIFRFENCELDTTLQELRRDGREVAMEPQVYELLKIFIEERGRVVTKDDLIERVWSGRSVADVTLSSRIAAVRRAIGDTGAAQGILKTFPKRGFRFVAAVQEISDVSPATPPVADAPREVKDEPSAGRVKAPDPPQRGDGMTERRLVTAAFCELLHSQEHDDPETWRAALAALEQSAVRAAGRREGALLQLAPNGLQIVFGYPEIDENAAEHAIRVSLGLLKDLQARRARERCAELRIGVCTGPALVRRDGADSADTGPMVVGRVLSQAQSLAQAAPPGRVVISSGTRKLVGEAFRYRRGEADDAWLVLEESRELERFDLLRRGGSSFVGRSEDVDALRLRWRRVREGAGQIVLLRGEAGIGKSRLAREFIAGIDAASAGRWRFQCAPARDSSMLYPVRRHIQHCANVSPGDDPGVVAQKIEELLTSGESPAPPSAAAGLLRLFESQDRLVGGQNLREDALRSLTGWFYSPSKQRPALLVFEDLHWSDSTTLELIARLVDELEDQPALILATARPEFRPAWREQGNYLSLSLGALPRATTRELVREVGGGDRIPKPVLELIVERSGGVPLLAEELTGAVLERSEGDDQAGASILEAARNIVPESLFSLILSRIEGVNEGREFLQTGAAIGEWFSLELISGSASCAPEAVEAALGAFVARNILEKRDAGGGAEYRFRHALLREAVYETLPQERARQIHQSLFKLLKAKSAPAEVLADHASRAGLVEAAVKHWIAAYRRSSSKGAYFEAALQLDKAVRLMAGRELRDADEEEELLQLNGWLAFAWIAAEGYLSLNARRAARDGMALAQKATQSKHRFAPRYALWTLKLAAGPQSQALERMLETRAEADASGSRTHQFFANAFAGYSSIIVGRLDEAEEQLQAASELYDPERHDVLASQFGHTPGADLSYRLGLLCALQDRSEECAGHLERAVARCAVDAGAHSRVQLHMKLGLVAMVTRDNVRLRASTEAIVRASEGSNLLLAGVVVRLHEAYLRAAEGAAEDAFPLFEEACLEYERRIMPFQAALRWTAFADLLLRANAIERAGAAHDHAARLAQATGEAVCGPELIRIEGRLAQAKGDLTGAEASLKKALAEATAMSSALWRRRASKDIAKLKAASR